LRASDTAQRAANGFGPDFSEALARGLSVIGAFGDGRRQMTLSEVARAVDLPKATARRALYTLARLGYVESDGRLYRLLPKILTLASAYLTSTGVAAMVQPVCDRITSLVHQPCTAAVLDGSDVAMVARAHPSQLRSIGLGIGLRLPAWCTALGRVLLAALPDDRLDALLDRIEPVAITSFTLRDRAALRAAIVAARRDGYAYVDQEAEFGFRSVAVPLVRYDGTVVAAMNVGARIEVATRETMEGAYLTLLRDEARALHPTLM
jgi:IclR family transcriptional regulator, pca regulon regulatory protein